MDIVCFCHLRWNFVYQRPQHILSRFSRYCRIFFIEEPMYDSDTNFLDTSNKETNIWIIQPHLQPGLSSAEVSEEQVRLLKDLFSFLEVKEAIAWYYTPMALNLKASFEPKLVVFDCMDELSAFKYAPPELIQKEQELLKLADIVFTGGYSLYQAKKNKHHNIYLFPSSIDRKHFNKARSINTDPVDQQNIPHPRIGFFGVIDERMDIRLLNDIAIERPGWNFIFIGPVVKIDPATLPSYPNIHYLGPKSYKELPEYISGWDVAIMPFAMNESTRYISPTKTPEYLAAGKPVVSTPIHDVVKMYGKDGLVAIAGNTKDFINALQRCIEMDHSDDWLKRVDKFLEQDSWDITCEKMMQHINTALLTASKTNDVLRQKEDYYV
jgi:glycosyltransferase involved in cell wall biosynthesis